MSGSKTTFNFAAACFLAVGLTLPSLAEDGGPDFPLPHLQPSCIAECADFKPATPILQAGPEYRSDLLGNTPQYSSDPSAVRKHVIENDWFTADEVVTESSLNGSNPKF